jgi:hypothetical protein
MRRIRVLNVLGSNQGIRSAREDLSKNHVAKVQDLKCMDRGNYSWRESMQRLFSCWYYWSRYIDFKQVPTYFYLRTVLIKRKLVSLVLFLFASIKIGDRNICTNAWGNQFFRQSLTAFYFHGATWKCAFNILKRNKNAWLSIDSCPRCTLLSPWMRQKKRWTPCLYISCYWAE